MALTAAEVKAVSKANHLHGAATVRRVRCGVYVVPSATEEGVEHTVTGAGPALADYTCSCPSASYRGVCWHIAATHLRRVQEDAKAQMRRIVARRGQPRATVPALAEAA